MKRFSEYEAELQWTPDLYNNPPKMGAAPSETFNNRGGVQLINNNGGGDSPVPPVPPTPIDYSKEYLTIEALEDGCDVSFMLFDLTHIENPEEADPSAKRTIYYSRDKVNWAEYTSEYVNMEASEEEAIFILPILTTLNKSEKLYFKGNNTSYYSVEKPLQLTCIPHSCNGRIAVPTGSESEDEIGPSYGLFNISGNILSLIVGDEFKTTTEYTIEPLCFAFLFSDFLAVISGLFGYMSYLNSSKNLVLTEKCSEGCYQGMFRGCTSLTTPPELPATTLAEGCYQGMFRGCTSLTTAPELPATTLAEGCYSEMFEGCTSLTTAPELPATALADDCYSGMFYNCSSLVTAPELPATALADDCYAYMFQDCTSLTVAPELPATEIEQNCYSSMFRGCSNLNYIKCLAVNGIDQDHSTNGWVDSVAENGTFIKHPDATDWPTGANGIPDGWTVQDA